MLLALLLMSACAVVRIGYSQAPDLLYWWIDGYFDVNDSQTPRLRDELAKLQQWHRASELPRYAQLLQKTQKVVSADTSAAQICALYADIRGLMDSLQTHALAPAAELATTLNAAQLEHLQRKFDKNNQEFARNFQRGTESERSERRLKTAIERSETVYGRLDEAQIDVIRSTVQTSSFDPRLSMSERRRRQQDLLQTLRKLLTDRVSPVQARSAIAAVLDRSWKSPDPIYRGYAERATQDACANVARIHNSTSAAQRAKAAQWLNGYENDFRSLLPSTV